MLSRRPRVLIVEDDTPIRLTLELALCAEGYEVRAEPDGCELEVFSQAFRPDLALLDVRLPVGPDGYAMAKVLRRSSDVPVLFLTAADAVEDRLAGFEAGADDYLVKPFSPGELAARVRSVLRRASPELSGEAIVVGTLRIEPNRRRVNCSAPGRSPPPVRSRNVTSREPSAHISAHRRSSQTPRRGCRRLRRTCGTRSSARRLRA